MADREYRQKVRDYLSRYRQLRLEEKSIRLQIEALRARVESAKSPRLSKLPKSKGGNYTLADFIVELEELEEDLNSVLALNVSRYREISDTIAAVGNPLYRTILQEHYLLGIDLKDIAVIIGYSEERTYHLHNEALDSVKLDK